MPRPDGTLSPSEQRYARMLAKVKSLPSDEAEFVVRKLGRLARSFVEAAERGGFDPYRLAGWMAASSRRATPPSPLRTLRPPG